MFESAGKLLSPNCFWICLSFNHYLPNSSVITSIPLFSYVFWQYWPCLYLAPLYIRNTQKIKSFYICYFCCRYFFKTLKYFLYFINQSLQTLSNVNNWFISKIILTASFKSRRLCACCITNWLYFCSIILSLLFLISLIIICFSSFLSTAFISLSTNAINVWPNIFSINCSSRSVKRYAAFALKIL